MNGGFPWRAIALVSLAVNLTALGAVAGGYAAGARFQPPAATAATAAASEARAQARQALAALAPEERAALRRGLAEVWRDTREERAAIRDAREALAAAVAADPYDQATVEAAFARLREAEAARQVKIHAALAARLANVTAEHRALALRLMSRPGGGPAQELRAREP